MSDDKRNILDAVFGASEEDVTTFMDVMKENEIVASEGDWVTKDSPDYIEVTAELVEQRVGTIQIEHGWHEDNYVWHFSPWHTRKPYRETLERVVYGIAQTMNEVIPQSVEVKIFLPYKDWEIPEVTFKAIDLRSCWNINDVIIADLNEKLFRILNQMT